MSKILFVLAVIAIVPCLGDQDPMKIWGECEKEEGIANFDHRQIKTVDDLPENYLKLKLCFYKKSGLVEDGKLLYEKFAETTNKVVKKVQDRAEKFLACVKKLTKIENIEDARELTKCEMIRST